MPEGHRRPERARIVLFLLEEAGDSVEFLPIREIMTPNWGVGNTPYIMQSWPARREPEAERGLAMARPLRIECRDAPCRIGGGSLRPGP